MPTEILMPALSPTMTEGNLAKWLKKEGDEVKSGEILAEIETDKATMEVEAVDEGKLAKILVPEQTENVQVNQPIGVLLEEDEDDSNLEEFIKSLTSGEKSDNKPAEQTANSNSEENNKLSASDDKKSQLEQQNASSRIFASPLAKRIAEQNNLNLQQINGSGPRGRIIKNDVEQAIEKGIAASEPHSKSIGGNRINIPSFGRADEEYTKIPNNNMRKVIAKRLCESKQQVPHFYLNIEVEIDKLMAARTEMNAACDKENPAYKISVNDMIIKASAMALRDVPEANASWSEEAILQYNNIDISVAVAIDGGLITPIVKNANQKPLSVISNEMKDLAKRARTGSLAPEEYQGGGFSISNLGMYGIKNFNAIINPPQSCILAIGSSQQKLVLDEKQQPKAVNFIEITLSCDHRVVDGAVGANFLAALKKYLEQPYTMLV